MAQRKNNKQKEEPRSKTYAIELCKYAKRNGKDTIPIGYGSDANKPRGHADENGDFIKTGETARGKNTYAARQCSRHLRRVYPQNILQDNEDTEFCVNSRNRTCMNNDCTLCWIEKDTKTWKSTESINIAKAVGGELKNMLYYFGNNQYPNHKKYTILRVKKNGHTIIQDYIRLIPYASLLKTSAPSGYKYKDRASVSHVIKRQSNNYNDKDIIFCIGTPRIDNDHNEDGNEQKKSDAVHCSGFWNLLQDGGIRTMIQLQLEKSLSVCFYCLINVNSPDIHSIDVELIVNRHDMKDKPITLWSHRQNDDNNDNDNVIMNNNNAPNSQQPQSHLLHPQNQNHNNNNNNNNNNNGVIQFDVNDPNIFEKMKKYIEEKQNVQNSNNNNRNNTVPRDIPPMTMPLNISPMPGMLPPNMSFPPNISFPPNMPPNIPPNMAPNISFPHMMLNLNEKISTVHVPQQNNINNMDNINNINTSTGFIDNGYGVETATIPIPITEWNVNTNNNFCNYDVARYNTTDELQSVPPLPNTPFNLNESNTPDFSDQSINYNQSCEQQFNHQQFNHVNNHPFTYSNSIAHTTNVALFRYNPMKQYPQTPQQDYTQQSDPFGYTPEYQPLNHDNFNCNFSTSLTPICSPNIPELSLADNEENMY